MTVKKLLDEVTLFVLSQSAPEFTQADSIEQRAAAQTVWRRHRDATLDALDKLEAMASGDAM